MEIKIAKKKDQWDFIKQHSGSHTVDGFSSSGRSSSPQQTDQSDIESFLSLVDYAIMAGERGPGPIGLVSSAYAGGAKYSQLKQIKSELESLKCKNLRDPQTFRRCQEKYREISKRLDAMGGTP